MASGAPVASGADATGRRRALTPLRTRAEFWVLAAGLLGFVVLAALYGHDPAEGLDLDVSRWVALDLPGWAETLARPFSWIGGWIGLTILAVIVGAMLGRERNWLDLGFVLAVLLGSQLVVALLKASFGRARPDLGSGVPLPASTSFPSGHATTGAATFLAVVVLVTERLPDRRARGGLWIGAALLGLAIGLSRIALNVHFVTDVVAGWCLGITWLAVCLLVRDALRARGLR